MEESIYFDPLVTSPTKTSALPGLAAFSSKQPKLELEEQRVKDKPFLLAYAVSLGVFIVTGLGALEWSVPTKMYNTFVNVLMPELRAIMIVSGITGLVWTWALSYFTRVIVYGMLLIVPTVLSLAAVVVLVNSGAWLVSLILMGMAGIFFGLIRLNQDGIDSTVTIVKSAAVVLKKNGQVYLYSFAASMLYVLLVLGWMVLFAGLFNSGSTWMQANAVMLLIWTGSIIGNYQRGMIANCVHNWYQRPKAEQPYEPLRYAGQFCFAGLVLTLVDGMRFMNWTVKKSLEQVREGAMKSMTGFAWRMSSAMESFLSHYTQYSVLQVVLSKGHHSFLEASAQVYTVFRRNILLSAINDMTSSMIFAATGACAAVGSGLIWHTINMDADEGVLVPMTVCVVTFMVLRFFTGIYTSAIDAAFLCYSLDVDTNRVEAQTDADRMALYQAFGVKLSQLPK